MTKESRPIVFFDGVCNFCNASIQWIIDKEAKPVYFFAPLQGQKAKELLGDIADKEIPDSVVLYQAGRVYSKSTAALRIAKELTYPYKLLWLLRVVPPFMRDFFYDIVAKNRYKWFGKKEACMLPSKEISARFLD